jgi:acetyl-CoA carboxylase carboxyl transferase subunit beta
VDLKPYTDRLAAAERKSAHGDAALTGEGTLDTIPVQLGVMDFSFIGGSMGSVVGEKLARAGLRALERRQPLLIVSASGGARMMEGIFSLMQMAKTSAVLAQLHEAGIPYVSILTDPTTGGVTASYAMLGDANLGEPGALIGFAGPRVIEQTIKQELPEGFQRSEFLLEHGMLDAIVDRREMKREVGRHLRHMLGLPEREEFPAATGNGDAE